GYAVAIDGNFAVVGANYDGNSNGSDAGSAYVFEFNGVTWVEKQKLIASDGSTDDRFGNSVAIHNDRVIVGAFNDNVFGSYSGSAYIFDFDGNSWIETQKLTPTDGAGGDYFGVDVDIYNN